jgi:hypothetical protein
VIKSRIMRWAGHVARIGREEVCTGFWWENVRERDYWEDPGVDGRVILRWIFKNWDVVVWTGLSWLRIGTGGGHFKPLKMDLTEGSETSANIKQTLGKHPKVNTVNKVF